MSPQGDRRTLRLEWPADAPLIMTSAFPTHHAGGWAYGQHYAFLRLWHELQPHFARGWRLDGELRQALLWHDLPDGHGRLLRTGCTVYLYHPAAPRQSDGPASVS